MRGALGLIAIAVVVWGFWMSYEWLVNRNKKNSANTKPEQ